MLQQLFSEPVSSGRTFDKKAKKIIRSHYKLIENKPNDQLQKHKLDPSMSERKENTSRSALTALAAENASTNENEQAKVAEKFNGNKIENFYSAEGNLVNRGK
jgi:hypothetical protein